jgi:hypothetical protein
VDQPTESHPSSRQSGTRRLTEWLGTMNGLLVAATAVILAAASLWAALTNFGSSGTSGSASSSPAMATTRKAPGAQTNQRRSETLPTIAVGADSGLQAGHYEIGIPVFGGEVSSTATLTSADLSREQVRLNILYDNTDGSSAMSLRCPLAGEANSVPVVIFADGARSNAADAYCYHRRGLEFGVAPGIALASYAAFPFDRRFSEPFTLRWYGSAIVVQLG